MNSIGNRKILVCENTFLGRILYILKIKQNLQLHLLLRNDKHNLSLELLSNEFYDDKNNGNIIVDGTLGWYIDNKTVCIQRWKIFY